MTKIIEGLKKIKELQKKAEDLRDKVKKNSAYLSYETPLYADQRGQINEWIQSHGDILKEILKLRISIQQTNLAIGVDIEIGNKTVTKSIAEWIHRRRDLSQLEKDMWKGLTDRNLKEGKFSQSTGEVIDVKLVRCYDAVERDKNIDLLGSESGIIDARLEVINAITDIIE